VEVVRQLEDQYLGIAFFLVLLLSRGSQKNKQIICGSRIPHYGQYLFGDRLVAIFVAGLKGVM